MELICLTVMIFWAIIQFIALGLFLIAVIIESKFVYYLKKGVN